jgi:hypothetical protein
MQIQSRLRRSLETSGFDGGLVMFPQEIHTGTSGERRFGQHYWR